MSHPPSKYFNRRLILPSKEFDTYIQLVLTSDHCYVSTMANIELLKNTITMITKFNEILPEPDYQSRFKHFFDAGESLYLSFVSEDAIPKHYKLLAYRNDVILASIGDIQCLRICAYSS
jgi:hypothetical protein